MLKKFDPKISIYCTAYTPNRNNDGLTNFIRDEYVTISGLFAGIDPDDTGGAWKVIDAEIVPASN